MSHSPEPWRVSPYTGAVPHMLVNMVSVGDGTHFFVGCAGETCDQSIANAERIAACVNACRGIPTDVLIFADQQLRQTKRAITGHLANPSAVPLVGPNRVDFSYYEENT